MKPSVDDDEDDEFEPEFPLYPSHMDRSATYVWPRLGMSAEDNLRGAVSEAARKQPQPG